MERLADRPHVVGAETLDDYPQMQKAIEDLNGLLTDIVLPEGIGADEESYGNAVSAHLAKRDARTKTQAP